MSAENSLSKPSFHESSFSPFPSLEPAQNPYSSNKRKAIACIDMSFSLQPHPRSPSMISDTEYEDENEKEEI